MYDESAALPHPFPPSFFLHLSANSIYYGSPPALLLLQIQWNPYIRRASNHGFQPPPPPPPPSAHYCYYYYHHCLCRCCCTEKPQLHAKPVKNERGARRSALPLPFADAAASCCCKRRKVLRPDRGFEADDKHLLYLRRG